MKNFLLLIFTVLFLNSSFSQQLPNLPIPIGAANAVVWGDSIYVFGGSDSWNGTTLYPRIYKFDGTSWNYYDSIPDNYVWDAKSILVGNYTYLLGGWSGGQSQNRRYNMKTHEWTYMADSPNLSQDWGLTAQYYNGNIYLFNSSGEVFAYNITGDNWITKTSNSATGTYDMSSVLYNNEVYIIGWDDSTFYKYTPATDQWTSLKNSPYQVGACAIGIINNLVYFVGGNNGGSSYATYKSILVYDITTNSWAIDSLEITSKRDWMASAEYKGGFYILGGIDSNSIAVDSVEEIVPQGTAGVNEKIHPPDYFFLSQNYPNPFNPTTDIGFQISHFGFVSLKIYDALGREVATLVNGFKNPGRYTVQWNAERFASGIYFYRITAVPTGGQTGNFMQTRKMILLK